MRRCSSWSECLFIYATCVPNLFVFYLLCFVCDVNTVKNIMSYKLVIVINLII